MAAPLGWAPQLAPLGNVLLIGGEIFDGLPVKSNEWFVS
jgi:hypothetical protein